MTETSAPHPNRSPIHRSASESQCQAASSSKAQGNESSDRPIILAIITGINLTIPQPPPDRIPAPASTKRSHCLSDRQG